MPQLLPPADDVWEARRPTRLVVLSGISLLVLLATLWVQSRDAEIRAATASPEIPDLEPGPSLTTVLGLLIAYVVPLLLWLWGQRWALHVMGALCFLGLVVFALSAATGFLWSLRVGAVPLLGVVANLAWLLVAYRRGTV